MDPSLLMQRCLDLAILGKQFNKTNPNVGSVLVNADGRILSEGFYRKFGGPHAERDCLRSTEVGPSDHLFVSLEPCNVHGKTPPCRDLLVEKGVQQLHIGTTDPNPLITGSSLDQLREVGTQIHPKVKETLAREVIEQFTVNTLEKRPYIILKWAQSADGFMSKKGQQIKLSNWASDRLVHKWRSEVDAILVGTTTALVDNPRLTNRSYFGPNPIRLVLDREGKIPDAHHLLDDSAPTIILGKTDVTSRKEQTTCRPYQVMSDLPTQLSSLYDNNVGSILVEGGSRLLGFLLETDFWDECRIIHTPHRLTAGVAAPSPPSVGSRDMMPLLNDRIAVYKRSLDLDRHIA